MSQALKEEQDLAEEEGEGKAFQAKAAGHAKAASEVNRTVGTLRTVWP